VNDHFYVCSNELLKSLDDGLDLRTAAAEYILAFENLEVTPTEPIYKSLKATAELIIKEEDDATRYESDYHLPEGMGYLFALQHTHGEPTNHVWKDGLQSPVGGRAINPFTGEKEKVNTRHAVWPYYQPSSGAHPYQSHHFPFHEVNHPLRRINKVTKMPQYVEMLKNHVLGGHSLEEKEMEKKFFDTLGKKHPLINGFLHDGKKIPILGDTRPFGTLLHHQHDLYDRDYRRWKKENPNRIEELLAEGLSNEEANRIMREEHFNDRANDWEAPEDNAYAFGENTMSNHAKRLGHLGYMLGLEWFSPEERTAIMNHIDEKGLDGEENIILPNGERIPPARLKYNALMRMTPEMNWAIRPMTMGGRNTHYNLEDNDKDYQIGESDMFHQRSLGRLSHEPLAEFDDQSLASVILGKLKDVYGESKKLSALPRLNIHKNPMDELDYEQLRDASKLHNKSKAKGIDRFRMTKDDLMYLAGYNPKTGELMSEHPLYGKLEEPVISSDMIDYIENIAKLQGSLHSQAKDIRNHRAFFSSAFGPHPEEINFPYWKISKEGNYSYGPGKFWSTPFQGTGGAGISLPTYHEILHATHANDEGVSPFTTLHNENENYIQPSEDNKSLANHFMPLKSQEIGELKTLEGGYKQFSHHNNAALLQNLLSPVGTSKPYKTKKGTVIEATTDKNNYTEHKSSLSPQYEYKIRHMSAGDRKEKFGSNLQPFSFPHTVNPTLNIGGKTSYGASPSDTNMHKNAQMAHFVETLGGRMNHLNTPAEKSMMKINDFLRGDEAFSGGQTKDDFVDFMRWADTGLSFNALKGQVLDNKNLNHAVAAITQASKILGTKNPQAILDYLYQEEDKDDLNQRLKARELGNLNHDKLTEGINIVMGDLNDQIKASKTKQKTKTSTVAGEKDAVSQILQFGGNILASQDEIQLLNELEELNQEFAFAKPEEREQLMGEIQQKENELGKIQQSIGSKSKSSNWKIDASRTEQLFGGHRNTVAEVARDIILPKYLEHDPDAFNPNDPQKFIDNNAQLFRDAQRYILSVPHSVHGIKSINYGTQTTLKPTQEAVANPFHATIAQHLSKDGKVIDGNMSVDEALKILNIEKTPVAKEKARELIELSQEMNTPLFASTVKDILQSGKIPNIDAINLNQFTEDLSSKPEDELTEEDKFYRDVQDVGYHEAIKNAQYTTDDKAWASHHSHAIPRYFNMKLNPQQFQNSMLSAGIGMVDGDIHNAKGFSSKSKARKTNMTKNYLDSIVHFDPRALEDEYGIMTPGEDIAESAGMMQTPVGSPNPNNGMILDNFDSGAWHHGYEATPTLGAEFDSEGNILVGSNEDTGLYHSVPLELSSIVHGNDTVNQVWSNAPPPTYPDNPHQSMNYETAETASEVPYTVAASEMTMLISSLIDPDVLLVKSDDAKWSPPIRPMHRIFDMKDLEHLRGFSGSWVVSKWYDGQRIVIVRSDDEIIAYDENGRKKGLRKATKEALEKMNDKNYTLDAILGEDEVNIIDIINYDDNNVGEMQLFERLKILRSQFDSQEHVIVPGPHDTRMTDDDGLLEAVENLKKEHDNILLRDNKSTYMRGERRHPKWILYRDSRDFNFIILDRRGSGPFTYQLGAGPILDIEGLGNRAVKYDGEHYMDVGTAYNQQKAFKVGDIVRASITGISKKNRKNRPVYNVQVKEIESQGEGEGAASTESLDLMTKSFSPILIPHDIEIQNNQLQIVLKDVDVVKYEIEDMEGVWCIHSPKSTMGDMLKSDYPVILAESLMPFWSAVAPLMMKGYVSKESELDMPKKPTKEQMEEESAGILEEDDEERILKPNQTKKALQLIERALDKISKEKLTWTGPKGLGIDVGTPQESPHGPTKLTDEANLPDYDGDKVNTGKRKEEEKERLNHIKVTTDEGENYSIDYDNDQPIASRQ